MHHTSLRFATLAVLLGTASACTDRPTETAPEEPVTPSRQATFAPLHSTSVVARLIPQDLTNRWIVVFHDGVPAPVTLAHSLVRQHGGTLHFTYQHVLKGFAATLAPEAVEALKQNPNVAFVEQDFHMGADSGISGTQAPADWGPDRIDQRDLPLDGSFTYDNDGSGVNIYILDTGIKYDEPEFGGARCSRTTPPGAQIHSSGGVTATGTEPGWPALRVEARSAWPREPRCTV